MSAERRGRPPISLAGVPATAGGPVGETPRTAAGNRAPSWFAAGVGNPIQVARVAAVPAPVGLTIRRTAAGSAPAGSVPVGSVSAPSIKRFPAHPERVIQPATHALLSRPIIAPPRGGPRGSAATSSSAPVQAGSATPAPPFALGAAAGGPPVPGVVQSAGVVNGQSVGVAIRRSSLVDQVPASLFERARAQLAGPQSGVQQRTTVRRTIEMNSPRILGGDAESEDQKPGSIASSLTPREWDQLVDIIVERLEDRVSDELSRRGRRFNPGVM